MKNALRYGAQKALYEAVKKQLGDLPEQEFEETCAAVRQGGASAGFHGFIYSAECDDFFQKNREVILKNLIEESCRDFLGDLVEWPCFQGKIQISEIARAIWTQERFDMRSQIIDALAWYALERVAQMD